MSSLQLDDNGDLEITNNSLTLTDGVGAIEQHLLVKFRLFLGEWFLDTSLGVPYYSDILIKNPSFVVVSEILKNVILETSGVLSLQKFEFDFDSATREATLTFKALTDDGPIDFSQVVEVGV